MNPKYSLDHTLKHHPYEQQLACEISSLRHQLSNLRSSEGGANRKMVNAFKEMIHSRQQYLHGLNQAQ